MTRAIDRLTDGDRATLAFYAQHMRRGVRWKGALRDAWASGVYGPRVGPDLRARLQELHNRLGTAWLTKFKL